MKTDGNGEYYDAYEDSPVAQYINQQYWDVEKGGLGSKESGKQIKFSYVVPVTGEEYCFACAYE